MKTFGWSEAKNRLLRAGRGTGLEDVAAAIAAGQPLDVLKHRNTATPQHRNAAKYPNQSVFVMGLNRYVYLVPFVDDADSRFPKSIIPSRKAMRDYSIRRDPSGARQKLNWKTGF